MSSQNVHASIHTQEIMNPSEILEQIKSITASQEPEAREAFEAYLKLLQQMEDESDRGVAILAAAHLDQQLQTLLMTKLVNPKELLEGALQHFQPRARAAYSLGFISKESFDNIKHIVSIRNKYAHIPDPFNFSDNIIQKTCDKFTLTGEKFFIDTRHKFIGVTSVLGGTLLSAILKAPKIKEYLGPENSDAETPVDGLLAEVEAAIKKMHPTSTGGN